MLRGDEAATPPNAPARPADLAPVTSIGLLVANDIPEIGVRAAPAKIAAIPTTT